MMAFGKEIAEVLEPRLPRLSCVGECGWVSDIVVEAAAEASRRPRAP